MSNWSDFYKNRLGKRYQNYCRKKYSPFIQKVQNTPGTALEAGCGIGTFSAILHEKTVAAYDLCLDQLDLAKENLREYPKIELYKSCIFKDKRFSDIIYSHGVLEHFSDFQIRKIVQRQLKLCSTLVHYVPLDGYNTPSFGDERLLSKEEWGHILPYQKSHKLSLFPFNGNLDLLIIYDKQ